MEAEDIIKQLEKYQVKLFRRGDNGVEPADPVTLSDNLLIIRGLLVQLVEKVAEFELDYRRTKAARFDKFIKEDIKRSPAFDLLDVEPDLIEKKVATERLRNYVKYVDGLCTAIQSVMKVQAGSDKNQY